jgi:bacterioferritin-associated ferredoxin
VIVCHCQGINDRSIRAAVRAGARSFGQVDRACEAGGACGGCRAEILEIIEQESARGSNRARRESLPAAR